MALAALAVGVLTFAAATFQLIRVARALSILGPLLFLLAPASPFAIGGPLLYAGRALRSAKSRTLRRQWVGAELGRDRALGANPPATGHGFDVTALAITTQHIPPPPPRSLLFEAWYELGLCAVAVAVFTAGAFAAVGRASAIVAPFLLAELSAGMAVALWGSDTTDSG